MLTGERNIWTAGDEARGLDRDGLPWYDVSDDAKPGPLSRPYKPLQRLSRIGSLVGYMTCSSIFRRRLKRLASKRRGAEGAFQRVGTGHAVGPITTARLTSGNEKNGGGGAPPPLFGFPPGKNPHRAPPWKEKNGPPKKKKGPPVWGKKKWWTGR